MKGFPDLPPLWWAAFTAPIYVFAWLAPALHLRAPVLWTLGTVLVVGALAVVVWAAIWFFKKRTPIEPHHTPKALVVEGPYRVSRNPIYLALVLLTAGIALRAGSPFGLLCAAGLAIILHRRFVLPEEAGLRAAFGAEADAYIASTRRWL